MTGIWNHLLQCCRPVQDMEDLFFPERSAKLLYISNWKLFTVYTKREIQQTGPEQFEVDKYYIKINMILKKQNTFQVRKLTDG